ncbi:MAG: universal stress protein [Nitrosopumilus sp.]
MYKNILVPHAGTSAGNKALDHAREMGKKHDSSVTILHIVEHVPIPPSIGFSGERKKWAKELQASRRELKMEMDKKLTRQAGDLKKDNIPVFVKVIHGYPDEEIIRMANEFDYDLVIMAKRRKLPGLKAILQLGSVSRKVLEKIHCPVMLIDGEQK